MQDPDLMTSSVHHAMSRSVLEDNQKTPPTVVISARCLVDYAEHARKICENNGTTLGKFLNECVKTLVDDYMGRSKEEA